MPEPSNENERMSLSKVAIVCVVIALVSIVLIVGSIYVLFANLTLAQWITTFASHGAVVFGLPFALLVGLTVIALLRIVSGPIKFEMFGHKFENGSAAVILWLIIVLVVVLSIRLLW